MHIQMTIFIRDSPPVAISVSITFHYGRKMDIMLENVLQWLTPVYAFECGHPIFATNFSPLEKLNKHGELKPINALISAQIST